MENKILGYEGAPFCYFEEISAIPRASGDEGRIADYIERFAHAHGLSCYRDGANNVFVTKPATKGREGEEAVLLQAHTDMVAEKNKSSDHDFTKDPIRFVQEGALLRADGTTLGADDGFGVSLMLSILDECTDHPALECLFTTNEEAGMDGAISFDYSRVSATRMINLDSDAEEEITVGCCGGQRSDMHLPVSLEPVSGEGISIVLTGLCGGHSGVDIHKGRANALTLMQRLLTSALEVTEIRLAHIAGGDKDNAIPRECEAVFAAADVDAAKAALRAAADELLSAYRKGDDESLSITVSSAPYTALIGAKETEDLLKLLGTDGGVLEWHEGGTFPRTSRNIASVSLSADGARVTVSTRSSDNDALKASNEMMNARVASVSGSITHRGGYPGWDGRTDSELVRAWQSVYREVTGKETHATRIHAGMECGLICGAVKGLEAIAVGCNILYLHTPAECMDLDSFARIWQTLLAFLKRS